MRASILSLLLLVAAGMQGCKDSPPEKTPSQTLLSCAPRTYEAALDCLSSHLPPADQAQLRRDGALDAHFGLGMWMRNNWGLWQEGPLHRAMAARGLTHPDDMSSAILDGFVARLREKPAGGEQRGDRRSLNSTNVLPEGQV
jgi:hypothetical protein